MKCADCHAEVPELRAIPKGIEKGREVCPSCFDQWDKTFNLCDRCGHRFAHHAECIEREEQGELYHLCPSCERTIRELVMRALDAFGAVRRRAAEQSIRRNR